MPAIVRDLGLNDDNGGGAIQLQIMDQFSWLIHSEVLHLAPGFLHEQKRAEATVTHQREFEAEKRQLGTIKLQRHRHLALLNGSLLLYLGARDLCG